MARPTVTHTDAAGNEAYTCETGDGAYLVYRDAGWWSASAPRGFGHRFSMNSAMERAGFPAAVAHAFIRAAG
jgi:hypothetical protein